MSNDSQEHEHPAPRKWPWGLFALLAGVLIVWAGSGFWIRGLFTDQAERGQFGDMFGMVNALFSGLAFGCLVYAIFQQQKALAMQQSELALQRQELTLQREELKLSRMEFAAQNEILSQQLNLQREGREPRFVATAQSSDGECAHTFYFENRGAPVLKVWMRSHAIKGDLTDGVGNSYALRITSRTGDVKAAYQFWLCFKRFDGTEGSQRFHVTPPEPPMPMPDEDRDDVPY
jgi:hypothetical protein